MSSALSRREVLAGLGIATAGSAAAPGLAAADATSVRGAWVIQPATSKGPAPFHALAAFAAGGVFITTRSDEAGTGIGEWDQVDANTFGFTYLNFHFDQAGTLANTVKVRAAGTFRRLEALRERDREHIRTERQQALARSSVRVHRQAGPDRDALR